MKKANILIESLLALSLTMLATFLLMSIIPETSEIINNSNPWTYLKDDCDVLCALKKALP